MFILCHNSSKFLLYLSGVEIFSIRSVNSNSCTFRRGSTKRKVVIFFSLLTEN